MLLDVASEAELKVLGKSWQQGELAIKIVMKQAQLSDIVKTLESVQGNIKMTTKITWEPLRQDKSHAFQNVVFIEQGECSSRTSNV